VRCGAGAHGRAAALEWLGGIDGYEARVVERSGLVRASKGWDEAVRIV
jgi:hypothetical protein